MEIILYLMFMLVGIAIGILLSVIFVKRSQTDGFLRIDQSDPSDIPYMFLEIKSKPADITRKKTVTLAVKCEDFIPHK